MSLPEATDTGVKIHPGVWGIIGAAIMQLGQMGVAAIKGGKQDRRRSVSDRLDEVLVSIGVIKETMATREDMHRVEGKIDAHVQAHAEHRFDQVIGQ